MNVRGKPRRSIWLDSDVVKVIDQRHLPHRLVIESLRTCEACAVAVRDMHVRGAGLIGVTAGFGVWLAARAAERRGLGSRARIAAITRAVERLVATRPTAVNLAWAAARVAAVGPSSEPMRGEALAILSEDVEMSRRIGMHGLPLIRRIAARRRGEPVNVMTHCNAGWLAFVDYGTATAPIYLAHDAGIRVHVWVSETRPRNQGAKLTAWELRAHGVPHTVIADNAAGHLMQHGQVDLVIVGADRVTRTGYAANKIGTYLKALAARDNRVPFYVAVPSSTFDRTLDDGVREIPIEERGGEEVTRMDGWSGGRVREVRITPRESRAVNYGFDVTPPRLITRLITDRGLCRPNAAAIRALFAEPRTALRSAAPANRAGEGVIKFQCVRTPGVVRAADVRGLRSVRAALRRVRLIGVDGDGVAYGNLSRRVGRGARFVISATGTGALQGLAPEHFVRVERCDLARNRVWCRGARDASAESMTHAAVYAADPRIGAVLHVHDAALWKRLMTSEIPRTPRSAAYGTPAIARAVRDVVRSGGRTSGVVVMGGHEDGLIAYGRTPGEAWRTLRDAAIGGARRS
jgi:methylthioribose-1-phosphate isomerase